ncbi:DJ-1/PfpI family protein [Paenibacillus nanensis]|uniref:DJ-1/PfpI family protein n=1 Tax=Paenibacillus nanensis TaxID=393251 RepID=A0A3A1USE1_9BACL|nr:DJ-1/PfpI family protein [Paenibacillus nanensis]RIX51407.1 DJ-1/PfpI family protein [Paenibacillus nanensis]
MLNVQIVLFDGFDLLDAIAPYEVFCAAELMTENALNVELVTAEGPRDVPSGTNGLKLEASGKLNPERAGIILVPGASGPVAGDSPHSVPAILARTAETELTGMLKQALAREDVVVATVCGGSLLLAMGGLMEGRPAVTNHLGMEVLGATGAIPVPARVVDDGNLVSGGGVTSGLDVALYLLERELGPRIAHEVERLFEFERRGTVWREAGISPKAWTKDEPQPQLTESKPTVMDVDAFAFDGDWDTTIATPVGKLQVRLAIITYNGIVHGKAVQGNETVDFLDPVLQGGKLTWQLRVTKPMRLNLKFEVTVDGDVMTGTAKAGMLPASKLTGKRIL